MNIKKRAVCQATDGSFLIFEEIFWNATRQKKPEKRKIARQNRFGRPFKHCFHLQRIETKGIHGGSHVIFGAIDQWLTPRVLDWKPLKPKYGKIGVCGG